MYLPVWQANTYKVNGNTFTNSSYSEGDFSNSGSCSGSSDCTISGSYTSEFLSQTKTHGNNSNGTNLTITSTGTLASLNISQSLNTITNSGTILGSIKECFDTNGNLKGGVCSVGNWYGQPIIQQSVNIKELNNNSGAVIGSPLKGLPVKYSGLKALNV